MAVDTETRADSTTTKTPKKTLENTDQGAAPEGENASPPPSSNSSASDLQESEKLEFEQKEAPQKRETSIEVSFSKGKSLKERSKIPPSALVTLGIVLSIEYSSGFYQISTLESWLESMQTSSGTTGGLLEYLKMLCMSIVNGEYLPAEEYTTAAFTFLATSVLIYIFFIAPLLKGFWTGSRSRKHVFHRYMGLFYLLQYFMAWVEYLTDYDKARLSYLPHCLSVTGIMQGMSAYFTFKVLPELDDAGYYSDKAVVSRNFVHENIFFTLMGVFGTMYYQEERRQQLRSNMLGRIIELVFIFFPYIAVRPWFPTTRFKNAGTTHKGRTQQNERFYKVSTWLVKIFFLYAKYYLGFFINFLVFLDLIPTDIWKIVHGLTLLNIGTVTLAIFLHTLRFRKVLPAKFTFSVYLVQIYATFSAIPLAYEFGLTHPKLLALCFAGLLCNMTRSRKMHAVWCCGCLILLHQPGIQW